MFLNNNILKRLMKEAYKRGLVVANADRIYIAGDYWEMDVRKEFLPKQILAQIIELAGEMPDMGERFKATKEGNQQEIGMPMSVDTNGFEGDIEVSRLILLGAGGTQQRLLQHSTKGKVYIVNNVFVEIADNNALEEEKGEYRVKAPKYHDKRGILWENNVARLRANWRCDKNHERLLSDIGKMDITEDPI